MAIPPLLISQVHFSTQLYRSVCEIDYPLI